MANTITIDALRQELWSKELLSDVMRDVENIMPFVGEGPNNIVQVKRELEKSKGDSETFGLVTRLKGDGVTGDDELEGNEEAQLSYSCQVAIDQSRNAVRLKGKLDAQKVIYDQIAEAREQVRIWMREFIVRQMFLKMGGVTNASLVDTNGEASSVRCAWSNTPDYIPNTDTAAGVGARYICAETTGAASIAAADTMTLDLVTKAATKAALASPKLQKLEAGGDSFYVMFLHPLCARDIRLSSDWKTANQNARERSEKNPVFRGALGYWSGVLLVENEFVPWLDITAAGYSFRGTTSGTQYGADTAANLLCGRQACLMVEASNPSALVVKQFDYDDKDGVAGSFIGGLQKAIFSLKEFGVIVVDAAAAV